jgi:hypothetical protein
MASHRRALAWISAPLILLGRMPATPTPLFALRCADHDWAGMTATIVID